MNSREAAGFESNEVIGSKVDTSGNTLLISGLTQRFRFVPAKGIIRDLKFLLGKLVEHRALSPVR